MDALRLDPRTALALHPDREPLASAQDGASFADHIKTAIEGTNTSLNQAEDEARKVAEGKGDIVEAVLAMSKADLELRHLVSLRNRLFDAYREVMRLQL